MSRYSGKRTKIHLRLIRFDRKFKLTNLAGSGQMIFLSWGGHTAPVLSLLTFLSVLEEVPGGVSPYLTTRGRFVARKTVLLIIIYFISRVHLNVP